MSGMTIRTPSEMKKFATRIDEYCASMRRVCNELKSKASSAAPMMKDEKSKKARQKIEALADALIGGLPEAEGVAETLRNAAKPLEETQNISM